MSAHCSLAQQLAGAGDMVGRLSAGLLADRKVGDTVKNLLKRAPLALMHLFLMPNIQSLYEMPC